MCARAEPEPSRLRSEQATAVLEAVIGKGRGSVVVDASTERVETKASLESLGREVATRSTTSDRTVSQKATLFVDETLSEDLVREGARAVTEVLALDEARGDDLRLVKAPLRELPPAPPDARARAGWALAAAAVTAALLLFLAIRSAASRLAGALSTRQPPAPINVHVAPSEPSPVEVHVPAPPVQPAPQAVVRKIDVLPRMGERHP